MTQAAYDVRAFGAVGDGVADEAAAFAAAIDAAAEAGGATVFVPPGKYKVSQLVLRSDVTIRGAGPALTSIVSAGGSREQFDGADATVNAKSVVNVGLEDLGIHGSDGAGDEILLALDGVTDSRFQRLWLNEASGRALFVSAVSGPAERNDFADVTVTNTRLTVSGERGVSVWLYAGPSYNSFENLRISDGAAKGLSLDAGSFTGPSGSVHHNYFEGLVIEDIGLGGRWTSAMNFEGASHNHVNGFSISWSRDPDEGHSALYLEQDQTGMTSNDNLFENGRLDRLPGRAFDLLSSSRNVFRSIVVRGVQQVYDLPGRGALISLGSSPTLNAGQKQADCSDNLFRGVVVSRPTVGDHYEFGLVMDAQVEASRDRIKMMRNSFVDVGWGHPRDGGFRILHGTPKSVPITGPDANLGLPRNQPRHDPLARTPASPGSAGH